MKTTVSGFGFGGWLALIFITLKLCKVIAWSWLWVLAPIWIPIAVMIAVMAGMFAFSGLLFLVAWVIERSQKRSIRLK